MATRSSSSTTYSSDAEDPLTLEDAVQHLLQLDDESGRRRFVERCLSLFPVDELLPYFASEFQRYFAIHTLAALHVAEALVHAADLTHQPEHRAVGLLASADALQGLGHYQESLQFY